ncbi:MAG: ATP-binding protein [Ruminococcus sp.]|nr:ATP-binding protein [Ruminococcus sp.]
MKKEGWFKVSSEIKNILGRDLITDSNIAILELVKNSYDAHATKVTITFDGNTLTIADNGKGMTEDDLLNKWLLLAYSAKKNNTEDADYRDTIKRKYAGAKGIGRLSCDRLGRFLTLSTKSASASEIIEMSIDWQDYETNPLKEFDQIPVSYEVLNQSDVIQGGAGTVLSISGLHDSWTTDDILALRKSLEKLINPFRGSDNFKIIVNVPFEIENDSLKIEESKKLRKVWDTLSPQKQSKAVKLERSIINGPIINSIGEVLNLKTTRIDSRIHNGVIQTKLVDRGIVLYEIEEKDKFDLLKDVSISLFYLNKQAKYNFSIQMGTSAVNYGSVFLFRNGFRILPYGQFGNDGWGIDQRIQQGYNRFLGSRELLGRVDVETEDPDAFKEVSSRDGGLINTPAFQQLKEFFWITHKRLERYVVGVLWGEGFLRREYFQKEEYAKSLRRKLHDSDKESETIEHVISNIGSKVDFLQIVKSLVNDDTIRLISYNEDLANIVSNVDDAEIIQNQLIEDFRKVANKTNDKTLLQNLVNFEIQLDSLRRQKQEAEKLAAIEKEKAKESARKAEQEKKKRQEEEVKRKKVEEELKQRSKQNLFLQSVGSLDIDRILKFHHDIRIHASTINNTVARILKLSYGDTLKTSDLEKLVERIGRANNKIMSIAQFATKANFSVSADTINADLVEYIAQYILGVLPEFYDDCKLSCKTNGCSKRMTFKPLEISLIIDNLLTNAIKAQATSFDVTFINSTDSILMTISDNGKGLEKTISDPLSVFEKGFTTTNGSGLGLFNIASFVTKELQGSIELDSRQFQTNRKFVINIYIPK